MRRSQPTETATARCSEAQNGPAGRPAEDVPGGRNSRWPRRPYRAPWRDSASARLLPDSTPLSTPAPRPAFIEHLFLKTCHYKLFLFCLEMYVHLLQDPPAKGCLSLGCESHPFEKWPSKVTAPHLSISRGAWEAHLNGHHQASTCGLITEETICKLRNNSVCWTSPMDQPAPRNLQPVSPEQATGWGLCHQGTPREGDRVSALVITHDTFELVLKLFVFFSQLYWDMSKI